MPTIAAANNLTIQVEDQTWSLLNGRAGIPDPILEAHADGLSYKPAFATARRLSPDGVLPADQISMVVVGWAVEDSSWHLGLMFTPALGQTRGGRWCGLARFDDRDSEPAAQAGQALAKTLSKPFRLVPPPEAARPAGSLDLTQVTQPIIVADQPPVAMLPLPITAGEWTLNGDEDQLLCERSRGWRNRTLLNAAFFAFLTLLFGALSLGARFSVFAPPQPDWLPLAGLGLAVLMVLLCIFQVRMVRRATCVVIDSHERFVRVVRGYRPGHARSGRVVIQSPYEGIQYVLVSHVMVRREDRSKAQADPLSYDRIWPEVWIHLFSPRRGFIDVAYVSQTEGRVRSGLAMQMRRPLDLHEIDTPVHHMAEYIAERIGVTAYTEAR